MSGSRRYVLVIIAIWVLGGLLSLWWNFGEFHRHRELRARETARAFVRQIMYMRMWNARFGGVYVPVGEHARPNPYLDTPDRDVTTADGRLLTKINPAYMTRQIAEISSANGEVRFHITSLHPIRPGNAPHAWERPWLEEFTRGVNERGAFVRTPGGTEYRYMAALRLKKACLSCHRPDDGHTVAGVRGGISVRIPVHGDPRLAMLLSHLAVLTLGALLLFFLGGRLVRSRDRLLGVIKSLDAEIAKRAQVQKALAEANERLDERVRDRTRELTRANQELRQKIRERSHMEEALIAIYDEFFQLFNTAPDGMAVIDFDHQILRVNQAFARLCGLPENRIIGATCHEIVPGSLCHGPDCPLERIRRGEERMEEEDGKIVPGGRQIPCIITAAPFHEPQGPLVGVVEVIKDISTLKETQCRLTDTAKRLQRSNEALEQFAHSISHDLQEPLILVEAFNQRLASRLQGDLDEESRAYMEQIARSVARMREMINGLLDYSRATRSRERREVDLNQVLEAVLADLALRIEESGARIEADPLPVVLAEPVQMERLFQNLIANALKYRREDAPPVLRITVSLEQGCKKGGMLARMVFADNGRGFAPGQEERIFRLFARLPQGKDGPSGSGVGLAICRTIVEHHGGTIHARGMPGQGAEFIVELPVQSVPPGAVEAEGRAGGAAG